MQDFNDPDLTAAREQWFLRDFATIYSQMWYRDFPLQSSWESKAQPADWTTHVAVTVRSTADLMGLFTRFERRKTDAVLYDNTNAEKALVEWEWQSIHKGPTKINEFVKLRKKCEAAKNGCTLSFAAFIGYRANKASEVSRAFLGDVVSTWVDLPPLLLVLTDVEWDSSIGQRKFGTMTFETIHEGSRSILRTQQACPWEVEGSKWQHAPIGGGLL